MIKRRAIARRLFNERYSWFTIYVGNGFDIAHSLPTSYQDFLCFFKDIDVYCFSGALEKYRESKKTKKPYTGKYLKFFKKYEKSLPQFDIEEIKKIEEILKNNSWAQYYAGCEAEINGWIDFEHEMIPVFDLLKTIFEEAKWATIVGIGDETIAQVSIDNELICKKAKLMKKYFDADLNSKYVEVKNGYAGDPYGVYKYKLLKDLKDELDEFVEAFRSYLINIVCKIDIEENPLIASIQAEKLISFNYTATEENYKNLMDSVTSYHVHGSVKRENSIIMGVEEVKEDPDNDYIYFVKYFQRIRKSIGEDNSGNSYREILQQSTDGSLEPFTVTIFGHSLDSTDAEIIKPFIEMAQQVTIYYYCEEDYEKKIINLISLLGRTQVEDDIDRHRIILKDSNEE